MSRNTISKAHGELTHPKYRPDIDGMRAIAILSVVGFHAFPNWIPGGFVGVDVFFVISGFLISTIIFSNLDSRSFSFSEFYSRRIRRIFPALIIVLAACLTFGWFALFADEYKQLGKHIAGSAGFVSNIILWNESGYFDSAAETKPLLHIWSLGIEEQFYIAYPLLVWLAYKLRFSLLTFTLLILVVSFGLNVGKVRVDTIAAFYSPLSRFWELIVGTVLAYFALYKKELFLQQSDTVRNAQSMFGTFLIVIAIFLITKEKLFPGWWALLPTIGAALIISAGTQAWLNRVVLANRVLVWFGLISFPLYLWHWPLLSFARIVESATPSLDIRAVAVFISIVLSWLTYSFIEKPVRLGKYNSAKVATLCLLMVVIGAIGYGVYKHNGLDFREVNKGIKLIADITAPNQTRSSDGSCELLIGLKGVGNATCLTRSKSPEIMVMGDSHAMSFNSAAHEGRLPLNTITISGHSCLPFTKYISADCIAITKLALDAIENLNSITTVALVNIGADSYFVKHYEENSKTIDARKAFVNGYVDIIERLIALNKRVVLVIDVPGLDVDPKSCMAGRPFMIKQKSVLNCVTPKKIIDDRNKEYRNLIAEISHKFPTLLIYDSQPVFCDDTNCYGRNEENIYYFDTNHLSLSGSERLLTDFGRWLSQNGLQGARVSQLIEDKQQVFTVQINSAPLFDSQQGWGPGYAKAIGYGPGVVVGPGAGNPNVFAQQFPAKPGEPFKVVARASSVDKANAKGRIQINWTNTEGKFISVSSYTFEVTTVEHTFEYYVVAPHDAVSGTLYVVADGVDNVVRYTEMRLLGKEWH